MLWVGTFTTEPPSPGSQTVPAQAGATTKAVQASPVRIARVRRVAVPRGRCGRADLAPGSTGSLTIVMARVVTFVTTLTSPRVGSPPVAFRNYGSIDTLTIVEFWISTLLPLF